MKDKSKFRWGHCYECGKKLTNKELKWNHEHEQRCCDGSMCGCLGLPLDPPYCFKCAGIYPMNKRELWDKKNQVRYCNEILKGTGKNKPTQGWVFATVDMYGTKNQKRRARKRLFLQEHGF